MSVLLDKNEHEKISLSKDGAFSPNEKKVQFCTKCGKKLLPGARFCTGCGNSVYIEKKKIQGNDNMPKGQEEAVPAEGGGGRDALIWAIILIVVLFFVAIFVLSQMGNYFNQKKDAAALEDKEAPVTEWEDSEADWKAVPAAEAVQQAEEAAPAEAEAPPAEEAAPAGAEAPPAEEAAPAADEIPYTDNNATVFNEDSYSLLKEFGIDRDTEEDYSANLDPWDYAYYDTGIGELYFSYPNNLFCDVVVDDTGNMNAYGENLRTICFTGSKGSKLYYSAYKRRDNMSIDGLTERLHDYEHDIFYDVSDILVKADDTSGKIVLSGVMNPDWDYRIYDLIKIDNEYVYRMLSVKPMYKDERERLQYAYVTENEYRMCGFSGSSKEPRTFQEFLESNP